MKAVVLAAGKQTRFKSSSSKMMTQIGDKKLIDYTMSSVLTCVEEKDIVFVTSKHFPDLEQHIRFRYPNLNLVFDDEALGTFNSAKVAAQKFNGNKENLLIVGAGVYFEESLIKEIIKFKTTGIAITDKVNVNPGQRSVTLDPFEIRKEDGDIVKYRTLGVTLLNSEVFDEFNNFKGEQIADFIRHIHSKGYSVKSYIYHGPYLHMAKPSDVDAWKNVCLNKRPDVKLENLCVLITYACNKRCKFCVNRQFVNKYERFMTKEVFIQGLLWAKAKGIKGIVLNGGEPTLHPNILEFATLAKEMGFRVSLFTNYSREDIVDTVKKLDSFGVIDKVTVSYYEQKKLPNQGDFKAELWLSTIVHKERFKTRSDFNKFIDSKKKLLGAGQLFFQTVKPNGTKWAEENKTVDFLEDIYEETKNENHYLWNKKRALMYRGCIIKYNNKNAIDYPRYCMTLEGEIHSNFDWKNNIYTI